jgi:predicted MPP superfamily phosphohydrolase
VVVSGHTHGGQVSIPFIVNGLFAPDQGLFPKYGGGRYEVGGTPLIISRGIVTGLRPRIWNPPEIVVLEVSPG